MFSEIAVCWRHAIPGLASLARRFLRGRHSPVLAAFPKLAHIDPLDVGFTDLHRGAINYVAVSSPSETWQYSSIFVFARAFFMLGSEIFLE